MNCLYHRLVKAGKLKSNSRIDYVTITLKPRIEQNPGSFPYRELQKSLQGLGGRENKNFLLKKHKDININKCDSLVRNKTSHKFNIPMYIGT